MSEAVRLTLPTFRAGEIDVPFTIAGMGELLSADTTWDHHAHPTHELLWNARGVSTVTVGTRTWTVTNHDGLWVPAGVLHAGWAPAGTWYRTAHFAVNAVPSLSPTPVAVEITPLLSHLLDRLDDQALTEASRSLTEAMILDVLKPSPDPLLVHVPSSELLHPIVEVLTADPGDGRRLSDWSEALGVSTRTLTRTFQQETGLGFREWQARLRAQHAILLLDGGLTLLEVAGLTGYTSQSAFAAAFRRTTGVVPSRFLNETFHEKPSLSETH
ncbi:AraC family transcriptional regulator [Tessaracoccus sp.]|uniref:AraC family transcriptional regulator n=1 Tax=Tessaracoccus sp. TaxID=1971211 RepID=UPI00261D2106|nr:AraC family transcriptional regulator [Tessaracoccus sp.]